MAGGGGNMESGEPDFQIAPMIDVLLVMLIFFMTITSAQVLRVDKNILLPVAPNSSKKDNSRAEAIINVRWEAASQNAVFTFQDKPYSDPAEFVSELSQLKEGSIAQLSSDQNPSFRVVIRADREVPALHVSRAMHAAADAGIADISFSTSNRE
jgi:biopolymer transport protein ExbD